MADTKSQSNSSRGYVSSTKKKWLKFGKYQSIKSCYVHPELRHWKDVGANRLPHPYQKQYKYCTLQLKHQFG